VADPTLLEDLVAWLSIPSVSTGVPDEAALTAAAQWAVDRIRRSGGTAGLVRVGAGNPLAVGELRAVDANAPTVLLYGHYDVQSVGDPAAWTSPAFAPEVRDGRLYARGAADDKGNFLPLLHAACELAEEGRLPVHVRVLVEGEEESDGSAVEEWLAADERGADCAIVFDSNAEDADTAAITVGLRGLIEVDLRIRTATRDLHSGDGGPLLNAAHVLHRVLAAVLPDDEGRLSDELRSGRIVPTEAERAGWARLKPPADIVSSIGGRWLGGRPLEDFYERTWADASLDVNAISLGEPRTIIPSTAYARLTMRLAPGQDSQAIWATLHGSLEGALPVGAEMTATANSLSDGAYLDGTTPALLLAARALERATGRPPVLSRSGGSIPIVGQLASRGIPVIVSGFGSDADDVHSPNESYSVRALELNHQASRELLLAMGELPRG
jgi:acetylornithine deacetylase/succinyl-diaminopimelate desuccinylase-like protein